MWCHDHINNARVSQRSSTAQDQQVRQVWSSRIKEALKHVAEKMFLSYFNTWMCWMEIVFYLHGIHRENNRVANCSVQSLDGLIIFFGLIRCLQI